ncbi:MAG TPA: hypothetical protein VIG76_13610 [Amnibacterium sp.]|jgi:hypothetical protein
MSEPRPILPLTLLGAAGLACEGDDCLLPADESATVSSTGAPAAL